MPQRIEVDHYWEDGMVAYTNTYEKSEVYCPNCGKQTAWIASGTDYYLGQSGHCVSCRMYHFNCNDFYESNQDDLERLRNATQSNS